MRRICDVPAIHSFRDLDVWQAGMELVRLCYGATEGFPTSERYGLTAQIRRAAVSIPANIAEGHCRPLNAYRNHVSIATGSQAELDTLIELAFRLELLDHRQQKTLIAPLHKTGQLLRGLARALTRMKP
jgi:four helix bundle protein